MTVIVFIVHALLVGALLTLAAHALDGTLAALKRPRRWIWLGAAAASLVLPLLVLLSDNPMGSADSASRGAPHASVTRDLEDDARGIGPATRGRVEWGKVADAAAVPARILQTVESRLLSLLGPVRLDARGFLLLWAAISASVATMMLASCLRLVVARRRWSETTIEGQSVSVSRSLGPAVVGVRSPRIVIPVWALALERRALRVILLHEREHVAARDTLVLVTMLAMAVLMPWNPVVWYQLRRARERVEMDCDQRVLAHGVSARSYGDVLVKVATTWRATALPLLAIAQPPSLLERRLVGMLKSRNRFRVPVALGGSLLFSLFLMLACALEPPPAPDRGVTGSAVVESRAAAEGRQLVAEHWLVRPGAEEETAGTSIIIRRADGALVPGAFLGPRKLMDRMSGGEYVTDGDVSLPVLSEGASARVREVPPGTQLSGLTGRLIMIRRADGALVPGRFAGPTMLAHRITGGTGIIDEGVSPRAREFRNSVREE